MHSKVQGDEAGLLAEQQIPRWLRTLCWSLAALALIHLLVIAARSLNAPLLDQHAFRQTQTALSTYWLARGSPWLAYETPVFGSPWAIPFEFPLFQLLTVPLTWVRIPLDAAGRLVSLGFMLGCLWPLRMLWRDLKLPALGLPIAYALILGSPEYTFWSRTFMIETTALFFAVLWLALLVRFLSSSQIATALAATVAGSLAVLAKATTLPAFALLGGLISIPYLFQYLRSGRLLQSLLRPALIVIILFFPFVIGIIWTNHTDVVKMASPVGKVLTSQSLSGWNYGTLAQRTSDNLWNTVLLGRMLPDFFGNAWPVALLMLIGAFNRRRSALVAAMMCVGFIVPILLFTNLHIVHNYYQTSNAIFLMTAVAIGIASLAVHGRVPGFAAVTLVIILAGQYQRFRSVQAEWMTADGRYDSGYQIALLAREHIPTDGSLIVLGQDWSSLVPYYAQRKALALPTWLPIDTIRAILLDPGAYLAGTRFAGVVACGEPAQYGPSVQPLVEAFLQERKVIAEFGSCRLLSAER